MTEDNWKRLSESGVLARYEKNYRVEIDGHLMSANDKCLIVRGHKEAATEVAKLLQLPVDEQIPDNSSSKPTVTISQETWKLMDEHNVLTGFKKGYKVDVTARQTSTGQWELTLSGPEREVERLTKCLQHAPRKLELADAVSRWLHGQGPHGARVYVIKKRANVAIEFSSDKRSALLIGSPDAVNVGVAMIKAIIVETVNVSRLQFELWFGHDGEQARERPHHRLEDSTDTIIMRDDEAGAFHVAGRPEGVSEALESLNKTRHVKLFASKVSYAMSNYIAAIRHNYEKDGVLQIHLAYGDTRSGVAEFRRLHRMNSENDDDQALTLDNDLIRKLGQEE